MFSSHIVKQITYAGAFLLVVFMITGIVATIMIGANRDPTLPAPSLEPFKPLVVEQIDVIPQDERADVVVRIRNFNARAGIPQLPITFILRDANGAEIGKHEQTRYILPGSVQYLVALNVHVTGQAATAELIIPPQPEFVTFPEAFTLPSFSAFLRQRTTKILSAQTLEEQKGIIRNTSALDWQSVEVTGVALAKGNKVVGVGQTFLGELRSGEQREFTLQWPLPKIPTERVVVLPTTNIFLPENIVKLIGDPSLLR